jgi:hypothetical protein
LKNLFPDSCLKGDHELIVIYEDGDSNESNVVRWCPNCGSIVVDKDYDGRSNPGHIMNMKFVKNWKTLSRLKIKG